MRADRGSTGASTGTDGPITPQRRAAVLGRPIAHSLSPVLHTAAYRALGLVWEYNAIECDEARLADTLAARADWAGFSCTMPLKRAALDAADEVRPLARVAGAANTLLPRPGGGWIADNTDVVGIVAAVREHGVTPATVTVLGAGGTAQALVAALPQLDMMRCAVLVRDPARTTELRATAAALGVSLDIGALDAASPAFQADLVVSTLPARVADALASAAWRPGQALLDAVYEPWPTEVARAAAARGVLVISGASMLLHQAAAQVELMTGRAAPVEAMRAALRAARPDCGA